MRKRGNLFAAPGPRPGEGELLETLAGGRGCRVERIVSAGHATPPGEWYDQPWDEWVALLEGRATLGFADGRSEELARGDWVLIPAHERHRVEATSAEPPCVWLAVHVEPR